MNKPFYFLSVEAKNHQLTPYVQEEIYNLYSGNKYFELAYFHEPLKLWKLGDPLPKKSIILTQVDQLNNSTSIHNNIQGLNILIIPNY